MRAAHPDDVKLVVSLLSGDETLFKPALERLKGRYGEIDFLSEPLAFSSTDYYRDEFGEGLKRRVASFDALIRIEALPEIKLFTNAVEGEYAGLGKRRINIDPGYIALEKLVLASCKNFAHRIYIGDGVYADLTLIYRGHGYETLDWTYPDYAEVRMRAMLKDIRRRYAFRLGKGLNT